MLYVLFLYFQSIFQYFQGFLPYAELQAKKEAEVKALKELAEKAEKERIEVEKLAKAPIKKQMSAWVNSFELPTTKIQNEKVDLIKQKFEAFKNWSLKEIEGL